MFKAPTPQSNSKIDYEVNLRNPEDRNQQRFYSRGHLTPFSDLINYPELTNINTNIAPQWQLFNSGNWRVMEEAIPKYTKEVQRNVFVATGTGKTI